MMNSVATFLAAVASAIGFSSPATTTPTIQNSHCVTITRPLVFGSTGDDVTKLQQFLRMKATGYFGTLTKAALINTQISLGIINSAKSDSAGLVGPKTRAALRCSQATSLATTTSSVSTSTKTKQNTTTTQSTTTPTTQAPPVIVPSAGGGGGGSGSSSGGNGNTETQYSCKPEGPQPAATTCPTGSWETIQDEAGCDVWVCTNPNDWQG